MVRRLRGHEESAYSVGRGDEMPLSKQRRHERAIYAPRVILCNKCDGLGTNIVQENKKDWIDRSTKLCETCQETGLKGIPESEVNRVRVR